MKDHAAEGGRASGPIAGRLIPAFAFAATWVLAASPHALAQAPPVDDPVARELGATRGIAEFEHGRYDRALEQIPPGNAGSAYYRGQSLLALKRAREAIAEFEKVRERPGAPTEVALDLGIAQLAAGNPAEAEATLSAFVAKQPDDPYGRYFLGVAQFRQKRYDDALQNLEAASRQASLAPFLDFYRGLAAYEQGDSQFSAMLDRFRAGSQGASADLASRLVTTGIRPGGRPGQYGPGGSGFGTQQQGEGANAQADRRWNLAVLTGNEYDSNVSLAPSIITGGLGSGLNRGDSRWVVAAFGEYRLVQRDELVVGLIGSTYNSFQYHLPEFDFQDYMGGGYFNAALRENLIVGARYEFHESLLGRQQFTTDHRLTPNASWLQGDFGHLTAYYEFESLDVTGFALVPAQIRTGNINSVGVTQAIYLFDGGGRFYLGYRYDHADTIGSDFDRNTSQISARIEAPLGWKTVGFAEARQFFDDYTNPNSLDFFGRPRSDQRIEVRVGAQKVLSQHVSLRAEYIYANNDSNVESLFGASFYSFDRHLVSTLLIYDF